MLGYFHFVPSALCLVVNEEASRQAKIRMLRVMMVPRVVLLSTNY